ncbi:MAG TPA: glycosyltransferase [Egibacteraceae bacterium]|jgi:UDP:flavonoid glycosyltransferase YjiC (YdhE family)|nr:glycosyltransferase [Egibacteraceae bacterium]
MAPLRVMCTCLPGWGHFLPMLSLARAVAEAGHVVAFATAEDFCPRIEQTGFAAFPAGLSLPEQLAQAARRFPEQHALPHGKERFCEFVPRMLAGVAAPERAGDLMNVFARWRPDILVHDETDFGGPVAAAVCGVPYADHSVGFLRPLRMARLARAILHPLWDRWDVDLGEHGGLFRYLYLDVCPPSLQSAEIGEIAVAHPMRNTDVDPGGDTLPSWVSKLRPAPTVYVSLGTIFDRGQEVFAAVLEGLRDEYLNVIVTVGNQNDPAALGPQPDNVHIERFIPQALLLPFCDVVVNQGGTAILPILAHALPLLVLPQRANQFHNAEACVAAGVARRLLPHEVTAEAVRTAVLALLRQPTYRRRSREVAEEIARMPHPAEAVRLLERLAEERAPLTRAPL